jgi:hypothetical protein
MMFEEGVIEADAKLDTWVGFIIETGEEGYMDCSEPLLADDFASVLRRGGILTELGDVEADAACDCPEFLVDHSELDRRGLELRIITW